MVWSGEAEPLTWSESRQTGSHGFDTRRQSMEPKSVKTTLEERAALAWEAHVAFLHRLADEGELSAESVALLLSERAKRRWLEAFFQAEGAS